MKTNTITWVVILLAVGLISYTTGFRKGSSAEQQKILVKLTNLLSEVTKQHDQDYVAYSGYRTNTSFPWETNTNISPTQVTNMICDGAKYWCEREMEHMDPTDSNYRFFRGLRDDVWARNFRFDPLVPDGTYYPLVIDYAKAWYRLPEPVRQKFEQRRSRHES